MEELISSETANTAARFFLSYINSTTTITASYALVIILGVAVALLGILGIGYMTASTIFTGKWPLKHGVKKFSTLATCAAFLSPKLYVYKVNITYIAMA